MRALYGRLSPRTRYLRFLSPMPVLPDAMLQLLACVDHRVRVALLAEVETSAGIEVVGLGNYGAMDDHCAEVGLVVEDAWQHQGIGTVLAARLLRAAEARGFDQFIAHVLWGKHGDAKADQARRRHRVEPHPDMACRKSRFRAPAIVVTCIMIVTMLPSGRCSGSLGLCGLFASPLTVRTPSVVLALLVFHPQPGRGVEDADRHLS